jgi:hypothetical protein
MKCQKNTNKTLNNLTFLTQTLAYERKKESDSCDSLSSVLIISSVEIVSSVKNVFSVTIC